MNGEASYENGNYKQPHPAHLICTFVENWFGAEGKAGDGVTWRCGYMITILSYLMSASQIPHTVVSGTCNGIDHFWIETEKDFFAEGEYPYEIFDPARKQFGIYTRFEQKPKLDYKKNEKWETVKFIPLIFKNIPDLKVESFGVYKKGSGDVNLSVFFPDEFPAFAFDIGMENAMNLGKAFLSFFNAGDIKPEINTPESVNEDKVLIKEKASELLNKSADNALNKSVGAFSGERANQIGSNPVPPRMGQIWQHVKNGKLYIISGLFNIENDLNDDNNPPIIGYMDGDGKKWARKLSDWYKSFIFKENL